VVALFVSFVFFVVQNRLWSTVQTHVKLKQILPGSLPADSATVASMIHRNRTPDPDPRAPLRDDDAAVPEGLPAHQHPAREESADPGAAPPANEEGTPAPPAAEPEVVQQLEERIRRLEATLTGMQEQHEKEMAAVQAKAAIPVAQVAPPPVAQVAPPVATVVPPNAEPGLREKAGQWMQAGKRMLAVAPIATAAAIPMAKLAVGAMQAQAQAGSSSLRHDWVLIEMYQELRAIVRMYFDRTYRPGIYAWVVPVVALSFMICSYFFIAGILVVGPILDKLFDLFLAYLSYKVLVREAERHQQHLALQQQAR
jgi:hypothetical protein